MRLIETIVVETTSVTLLLKLSILSTNRIYIRYSCIVFAINNYPVSTVDIKSQETFKNLLYQKLYDSASTIH